VIIISRFRKFLADKKISIKNTIAVTTAVVLSSVAVGYSAKADRLQTELDNMKGKLESLAIITAVEANVMERSPYPMARACDLDDDRDIVAVEEFGAVFLIPLCIDNSSGVIVVPTSDVLRFKARYLAKISSDPEIMSTVSFLTEGDSYCVPEEPRDRVSVDNYSESL